MSERIHRSPNVSVLLSHIVCPAKHRRAGVSADVDTGLRDVCLEIAARYEITFLEIGTDRDHVHVLVQTIPLDSSTKVVRVIKRLTAREGGPSGPRGEAGPLGRRVLVGRVLHQHGWPSRERR